MKNQKDNAIIEKDYFNDLEKIKETIRTNQNKAMVVVNSAMIMTYYEIGTIINLRKTWGSKYIQNLANDLNEYGNSFSYRNLKYMSQFAREFSYDEIRHQPGAQIPWRTIIEVMANSATHEEMLWYIKETYKNGWSRSMVLNQIAVKAYERSLIEPDTSSVVKSNDLTNELFKETYVFDFIDKNSIKTEKDLKYQMVDNIIRFLQELGPGFTLAGKEYKLVTPTNEEFFIDLLMYHTKLHCYVVIEVKIGKFNPADLGQLIFYTNYIDTYIKSDYESPTIGIVLCSGANSIVCRTTLKNTNNLAVSKYKIIEELPEYLEKRLNETK